MSKPVFLNHEIVFNPTGNEFDKARDQLLGTYRLVKIEDWEYKFIKQPKLRIPKWVADIFDEFLKDDYDWHDFEMSFVGVDDDDDGLERKFFDWTNSENATELTLAYLNPLTRAFVEVEG